MALIAGLPLLAYPFRLFFLLCSAWGAVAVTLWVGMIAFGWSLPLGIPALQWHIHAMLLGFVPAAIAGFLLTAVTNWTPARPLQGTGLLALGLLWLLGRAAILFSGPLLSAGLPYALIAAFDLAFLLVLAIVMARAIFMYGSVRNLPVIAVLVLLIAGNLLMHIAIARESRALFQQSQTLIFDLILLLMAIIGGRIIPLFTANWLKMQGRAATIRRWPALEAVTFATTIAIIPLQQIWPHHLVTAAVILLAGLSHGLRLMLWCGWKTLANPLLWVLHLGYGWLVLALIARSFSVVDPSVPASLWEHLMGLGAIGTLIFAVMTRVALGHTGRPLQLPRFAVVIYLTILLATLLRAAAILQWLPFLTGVAASAACWVIACLCFIGFYWPILTRPRVDGRPG